MLCIYFALVLYEHETWTLISVGWGEGGEGKKPTVQKQSTQVDNIRANKDAVSAKF
jgi:hypothetical protein